MDCQMGKSCAKARTNPLDLSDHPITGETSVTTNAPPIANAQSVVTTSILCDK